jgi:hypothetical protein
MDPSSSSTDTQDNDEQRSESHSQSLPPPQCQRHPNNPSASPAPLSKNARKKAIKAERYAAAKLERRARVKERKKEKKRQKAIERDELGEDNEVDQEGADRGRKRARTDSEKGEGKRRGATRVVHFGGTVVVDLGFDELMEEKVVLLDFLLVVPLTRQFIGNCIIDFATCLYLQHKQKSVVPFLATLHFTRRTYLHAVRDHRGL